MQLQEESCLSSIMQATTSWIPERIVFHESLQWLHIIYAWVRNNDQSRKEPMWYHLTYNFRPGILWQRHCVCSLRTHSRRMVTKVRSSLHIRNLHWSQAWAIKALRMKETNAQGLVSTQLGKIHAYTPVESCHRHDALRTTRTLRDAALPMRCVYHLQNKANSQCFSEFLIFLHCNRRFPWFPLLRKPAQEFISSSCWSLIFLRYTHPIPPPDIHIVAAAEFVGSPTYQTISQCLMLVKAEQFIPIFSNWVVLHLWQCSGMTVIFFCCYW